MERTGVNGFWIPVHKDLAATEVTGYLYCCSECSNVSKDPKGEGCPKCGAKIDYESRGK